MLAISGETPPLNDPRPDPAAVTLNYDWPAIVEKVKSGSQEGMEELYRLFGRGIRFYLCRQLGPQELDDKVHDTFIIVVQAIQRGDLREPDRLLGFIRTIVRRLVAAHIDTAVQKRRDLTDIESGANVADSAGNPEDRILTDEKSEAMLRILQSMSARDREILTRFYLKEETQEQICREMNLSDTQFRLLKSRAKARFGDLGRRSLLKKRLVPSFWMRTLASVQH